MPLTDAEIDAIAETVGGRGALFNRTGPNPDDSTIIAAWAVLILRGADGSWRWPDMPDVRPEIQRLLSASLTELIERS